MSEHILKEVNFFQYSVAIGAGVSFLYDWLRVLRRVVKHNVVAVSIEDIIFWVACFGMSFLMLYKENNGTLRWFAVMGAGIGMFLYKLTISRFLVKYATALIKFIQKIISAIISFFTKPLIKLLRHIKRKSKTFAAKQSSKAKTMAGIMRQKARAAKKRRKLLKKI